MRSEICCRALGLALAVAGSPVLARQGDVLSDQENRGQQAVVWVSALAPELPLEQRRETLLALRVEPGRGSPALLELLASIAGQGAESELGLLAMEILGAFDTRAGCQVLIEVAKGLEPAQGALALGFLPDSPRSLGPLLALLGPGGEGPGLHSTLTVAAIAKLAPLLVDPAAPPESPGKLVFLSRGVDPTLRAAGALGLQTLLGRLAFLGDSELMALRGEAILRADPHKPELLMDLVRATLMGGGDWDLAQRWSEALLRQVPGILLDQRGSFEVQLTASRIHLLAAIVATGGGDSAASQEHLARAHTYLAPIITARGDRTRVRVKQTLHMGAMQVRVLLILADLYGALLLDPGLQEEQALGDFLTAARELHKACLEFDAAEARQAMSSSNTWDAVLRADLSIVLLLIDERHMPGLSPGGALAARLTMGRLLATVSGREMPGFEPFSWDDEVVTNPLKDPERVYWIDVTRRRMLYTSEQLAQARREAVEALQVPFLIDVESFRAEQEKAAQVRFARNLVQAPLDWSAYSNLRWPSDLALVLAAEMRREGRPLEALALAARYGRDMTRASDTSSWFLLSQIQQAKAEMQQGSAYTDLDEPLRAEESLLRGVERIESLIATLKTRGMAARVVAQAEEQLARLLSSLAVNANVKLGQPERAVAWVERAHELSANGASTVLLACYRARAGRLDEARDLLRRASPEPGMEYNLACTHALLGNREAALDWLRRSLDQSGTSPGELRREKDWAARDPDLGSLRDDPRFAALVQ
jgi:tetratricopeptide (TPR) repeat protein